MSKSKGTKRKSSPEDVARLDAVLARPAEAPRKAVAERDGSTLERPVESPLIEAIGGVYGIPESYVPDCLAKPPPVLMGFGPGMGEMGDPIDPKATAKYLGLPPYGDMEWHNIPDGCPPGVKGPIVNIPGFGEVGWKGTFTDTKPLLDDIQRLTEELELARTELAEVRAETYDDKMGYWKNRALMAEARAKQLEEMN